MHNSTYTRPTRNPANKDRQDIIHDSAAETACKLANIYAARVSLEALDRCQVLCSPPAVVGGMSVLFVCWCNT
jgi:hypothetical protein